MIKINILYKIFIIIVMLITYLNPAESKIKNTEPAPRYFIIRNVIFFFSFSMWPLSRLQSSRIFAFCCCVLNEF